MLDTIAKYDEDIRQKLTSRKKKDRETAFEEVYNNYSPVVHAYCKYYLGSDEAVKDIFQEAFIRFYKYAIAGRDIENIAGYLVRTVKNLCLNYIRDKKNNISLSFAEEIAERQNDYENSELLDLIASSLEYLEPKYREIFIMHEIEGMTYKEISEKTGILVETVRMQAFRSKQMLIKILKPYIEDLNN